MGNAVSAGGNQRKNRQQQQWGWEFKDGRAQIKARGPAAAGKPRPLFKKQPSDNYDWWIFNPNANKRKTRRGSSSARRK